MISRKTIPWKGRLIEICGREGDSYFDHLNLDDGTNDFLLQTVDLAQHNAVIFDVGANIGMTTVVFSNHSREGSIYSFEPDPEAFASLQATIKANQLENVKAQSWAIGAASGEMSFIENQASSSASHLAPDHISLSVGSRVVLVKTIDEIAEAEHLARLDLIKIDVEGFEMAVLEGATRVLRQFNPLVFMEFNSFTFLAFGNVSPRAAIEQLVAKFTEVYCFRSGSRRLIKTKTDILDFLHSNMVCNGCVDDLLCVC